MKRMSEDSRCIRTLPVEADMSAKWSSRTSSIMSTILVSNFKHLVHAQAHQVLKQFDVPGFLLSQKPFVV